MNKLPILIPILATAFILVLGLAWFRNVDSQAQASSAPNDRPHLLADTPEAAGRYLVVLGGCNDCHTPGWGETGGKVPQDQWLLGSPVGFTGPWGTTYPANVRRFMQALTEDQWVEFAHRWEARPPMPSMNLHHLSDADLRAMHRFVRSLGHAGDAQPTYLPPGQTPTTPYIDFTVRNLPTQ